MGRPVVHGADYSVYVRIVRLALAEKGVDYDLVPVDIFSKDGVPGWYRELHPFGRIPAFEHDGFRLYETGAITRYVDEAFAGSPLQPGDPKNRALMNQIVGILDAYAYRTLVWDVYVETVSKPKRGETADETLVAQALVKAETCLAALARLKQYGPWLLGESLTLADLHAAPIFAYFVKAPAGKALLAGHRELAAWRERIANRASFLATEPSE